MDHTSIFTSVYCSTPIHALGFTLIENLHFKIANYIESMSSIVLSPELREDLRSFYSILVNTRVKLAEFWLQHSGPIGILIIASKGF